MKKMCACVLIQLKQAYIDAWMYAFIQGIADTWMINQS